MTPNELQEQVEKLVDSSSVKRVVDALATTCYLKAQHIEENWQDRLLAKIWERAARILDRVKGIQV